ncbi:UNVERIFIED_CONTAM: hypothetical protein PYX00_002009 [Menopon gallinae]|uniref:Nucleotide exchange factor Fes1 domain-containing protein n=1 Tax=Menopon gallinae TaxID=328185 RepID=A0AAW2IGR8_9NEOP
MSQRGQDSGDGNDGGSSRPQESITYPSGNLALPEPPQPRPPRSLQDLLRYSTEVTTNSVGSSQGSSAPLDDESRKFLEAALKSLTVDIIGELMKCIEILQMAKDVSEDSEDSAECEAALDHIFDFVDNIDVANDFHKIGGFSVLNPCLNSLRSSIRWRGAELVAYLCQNNPYCQNKILESRILSTLLNMIDTDINDTVKVKAMYAVSCIVRDNEEALKEFGSSDGYSVLLRALQSDIVKLNIKAAFLLTALCSQKPDIKDELVKMGYVEQLVGQIAIQMQLDVHSEVAEHLLSALLCLIQDHEPSQTICKDPELQFREVMKYVIENSDGKDQYREEYEYAQSLLNTVFKDEKCAPVEDR